MFHSGGWGEGFATDVMHSFWHLCQALTPEDDCCLPQLQARLSRRRPLQVCQASGWAPCAMIPLQIW